MADNYNIYLGAKSEAGIDWDTPIGTIPAGQTSGDIAGVVLEPDTRYFLAAKAVSAAGVESDDYKVTDFVTDAEGNITAGRPNAIAYATLAAALGGKVSVSYVYNPVDQVLTPSYIEAAVLDAGGAPDWDNSVQLPVFPRAGQLLDTAYHTGTTVRLALRAVDANGVAGPVKITNRVTADAEAPTADARILSISS